jgi:hypothetical protein
MVACRRSKGCIVAMGQMWGWPPIFESSLLESAAQCPTAYVHGPPLKSFVWMRIWKIGTTAQADFRKGIPGSGTSADVGLITREGCGSRLKSAWL